MRRTAIALALTACHTSAELYGGGELTLTAEHTDGPRSRTWSGATKAEIRDLLDGTRFDESFAHAEVDPDAGWVVIASDPMPSLDDQDALAGLFGLTCSESVHSFAVGANNAKSRSQVWIGTLGDELVAVDGPADAANTFLAGTVTGAPTYYLPSGCTAEEPTSLTITWSFEDEVLGRERCIACGSVDL